MDGYRKVAELMAEHEEFAIFRRFRALNMQNLLYLQAEITHLEKDLGDLADRDSGHPQRLYHNRDWWSLANGQSEEDQDQDQDQDQWQKVLQLRKVLEIYNDAVLKQAQLARLDIPSCNQLNFLRLWLQRPQMGNFPLLGLDRTTWNSEHEHDLLAMRATPGGDYFSVWVFDTIVPLFHRVIGERIKRPDTFDPGLYSYDDKLLSTIVFSISTIIASVLPICSVVVLYYVQSPDMKLGLAVAFCACFAIALVLLTNAKKVEVFASTAA